MHMIYTGYTNAAASPTSFFIAEAGAWVGVQGITTTEKNETVTVAGTAIVGIWSTTVTMATDAAFAVQLALPTKGISGTAEKIDSFSTLPKKWYYGSGAPPQHDTIESALWWNSKLIGAGFDKTDAFPGVNGEIMVTGYSGPHYIEVLVEPNLRIDLIYEINKQEQIHLECVTTFDAYKTLEQVTGGICNISAYSTQGILTVNAMSLKALHSKYTMMELPSSNDPASKPLNQLSANTFENFIPTWAASRLSSGFSTKQYYPQTHR
jgi:hypothetical protein